MTTSPDYSFSRGLEITSTRYPDGESSQSSYSLSRDFLANLPNVGDDPARDAQVAEQMKRIYTAKGLGDRAVGYILVGPDDASTVKFQGFGWGGDAAHPVAVGELQALAASDPDSQWLIINTPGSGQTDPLPRPLARELQRTGSYDLLGYHYTAAVANVLDGRQVHLRGHSLGGRTALGMAPHIKGVVESLVINDPTGSKRMSLGAVAQRFLMQEGGHLGRYIEAGFDPGAAERQRTPAKDIENSLAKMKQMFAIDPIALTRDSFEHDLRNALPKIHSELRILSPELSALNSPEAIADVLGRVTSETKHTALVEQWVLKGHTHSFMAVAPAVEAFLYKTRGA